MEQDDRRRGRASERGVTPRKHAPAKPPAALFLPPPAAPDEPEPEEREAPKPARRTSAPAAAFRAAPVAEQLTVDLPPLPAARPPAATAAPRFESEPEPEPPMAEEAAPAKVRRTRKPSGGAEKAAPPAEQTEIIEAPPAGAPKKAPAKRTTSRTTAEPAKTRATKPRKTAAKAADAPPADLALPATAPESSQVDPPTAAAQPDPAAAAQPPAPEPPASEPPASETVSIPAETAAPEAPSDVAPEVAEVPAQVREPATPESTAPVAADSTASAEAGPTTAEPAPAEPPADHVVTEPVEAEPAAIETVAEADQILTAADEAEVRADGVTVGRDNGAIRGAAIPRTRAEVVSTSDLWAAVREQPRRAPAALALAAVARHAATARRQADWLRRTYPHVAPDRLARVSIATAGRRARVAALASTLPLGGVAGLSAQLWAHARMVLEIAALYGFDPAEPARAAEMLALLGVYPEVGAATAAVHAISGEATPDRTMPAPRVGVATAALVRQAADRLVPGSALVMAALGGAVDVDDLAARTVRFYGARRA